MMSELGKAFYEFALAQLGVQQAIRTGSDSYEYACKLLETRCEDLAKAFSLQHGDSDDE